MKKANSRTSDLLEAYIMNAAVSTWYDWALKFKSMCMSKEALAVKLILQNRL